MKKLLLVLLVAVMLIPSQAKAQNNGAAVAAGVGALLAVGATVAAVKAAEEAYELQATQWVLGNTEFEEFELKIFSIKGGKKSKDISAVSLYAFRIKDIKAGKRYVLLGMSSYQGINENGVRTKAIIWDLLDQDEWYDLASFYASIASGVEVKPASIAGVKIYNKGLKKGSKTIIPFNKIKGDVYLSGSFSDEYKVVFNEKSLGLFIKKTGDLVQLRRSTIIDIHEFLSNR